MHPDRYSCERGVELEFFRRGKPTDDAQVESFNGRLRQECLNVHGFFSYQESAEQSQNLAALL